MKARAPPYERDPGVPAEGVPPRRYCRLPTRLRTLALCGAKAPSGRARAPRARDCMPARAVLPRATTLHLRRIAVRPLFSGRSATARRRSTRGPAPTHPPTLDSYTAGAQGYYWAANSAPGGASRRPCRVLQHDQELRARLATSRSLLITPLRDVGGALAPQRKTRRFTGDRKFGVETDERERSPQRTVTARPTFQRRHSHPQPTWR